MDSQNKIASSDELNEKKKTSNDLFAEQKKYRWNRISWNQFRKTKRCLLQKISKHHT